MAVDPREISEGDQDDGNEARVSTSEATPFVKWVGGKRGIIDSLVSRVPEKFGTYYEPFVGGGALFFSLNGRLTDAFLSDTNFELVITYNVIKKDPQSLIEQLEKHTKKHQQNAEEYYYKVRSQHNLKDPVAIAARFIYLNKTCYNGLYRVNKSGEFNVPIGRYTNPTIVQRENIMACSRVLQKSRVEYHEFDAIKPQHGDFVYFDPPYHPTNDSSFTSYTKLDFSEHDQARLRDFALQLHKRGVHVMLSNSDTKFIRDLYSDRAFRIVTVQAPRNVNCKPTQRNSVSEVLITNYETHPQM
ncbi:MAG TPA: DNA adenine methylase [Chloroflexia bacterium]